MMTSLLFMTLLAAAPAEEIRPEIAQSVQQAQTLILDLEEQKALDQLDALTKQQLSAPELALVQMWRGIALMGLNKPKDAQAAFALARGCNPLMEPPTASGPKVAQAFKNADLADCPVATATVQQPEPEPVLPAAQPTKPAQAAPAPAVQPAAEEGDGGAPLPMMSIAGIGVAAAAAVIAVLSVVGATSGLAMLIASFPVLAQAQAQERAKDVRQGAQMALGLRIGGLALAIPGGLVGLIGLVGVVAGIGLAAAGFMMSAGE
ncbi:MAG: hypothetical protein AB2A00_25780 [Myxococcota bacterium]